MASYDYIARGVRPIGEDLTQIAGLNENRSRFQQLQKLAGEERTYQRDREKKADERTAKQEELEHALAKVEWALQSPSPAETLRSDPAAVKNLGEQGIDVNSFDDAKAKAFLSMARGRIASQLGVRPDKPDKAGAPVKVNRGGKPIFATAEDAIGEEAYENEPDGARGTWSSPWRGKDPKTGKVGLYQTHSLTGQNRPAQVGADGLEAPPSGGEDGDGGGLSSSLQSLVFRQAAGLYGGTFDPVTGNLTGLDAKKTAKVQDVAARASRLMLTDPSLSAAEAVQEASQADVAPAVAPPAPAPSRPPTRGRQSVPRPEESTTLPPAAVSQLKEGIRTTFKNGQVWTMRGGQPVRLQ